MTTENKDSLTTSLEAVAARVGLTVLSVEPSTDLGGNPTSVFCLARAEQTSRTAKLTLSKGFHLSEGPLTNQLETHLANAATRLRNPRPDYIMTLGGLPLALGAFQWPLHAAHSGSDTYIVHGEALLADGVHDLRARIAAAVSQTFAEIVPAMEQPYTESFVFNAMRKYIDLGQIEFIKSGGLQPVPVTTRYYSRRQKCFLFTDATPAMCQQFLLAKVYWLSAVLGSNLPVWITDPRDAEYLNTSAAQLFVAAERLGDFLNFDGEFATATPALVARAAEFESARDAALAFTKAQFNEAMRSGQANM